MLGVCHRLQFQPAELSPSHRCARTAALFPFPDGRSHSPYCICSGEQSLTHSPTDPAGKCIISSKITPDLPPAFFPGSNHRVSASTPPSPSPPSCFSCLVSFVLLAQQQRLSDVNLAVSSQVIWANAHSHRAPAPHCTGGPVIHFFLQEGLPEAAHTERSAC